MHPRTILVAAMLALGVAIPSASFAGLPILGISPVGDQMIACDSEGQVREIHNARLSHGVKAGVQVFARLRQTPGVGGGEPACMLGQFNLTIITKVITLPMLNSDLELRKQAFLIQLTAQNGFQFWGLWQHTEAPPLQPSSTLSPKGRIGDFRFILDTPSWNFWDMFLGMHAA